MSTLTPLEELLLLAADAIGHDPRTLPARASGSPLIVLGGGLAQAMRLRALAEERLGLALDLARLLGPAPLADTLARAVPAAPRHRLPPVRQDAGGATRVLSADLTGPLERAALDRALLTVSARHPRLRAAAGGDVPLLDRSAAAAGVAEVHADLAARPPAGPLHLVLTRLRDDRHVLSMVYRETVADSWSAALVGRELIAVYDRLAQRQDGPRAETPAAPAVAGQLLLAPGTALRDAVDATARRAGVPHATAVLAGWALTAGRRYGLDRVAVGVELPRGPGRAVVPAAPPVPVRCELGGGVDYFLRGVACAFSEALAGADRAVPEPVPVLFAAHDELLPARPRAGALDVRFHHGRLAGSADVPELSLLRWREGGALLGLEHAGTPTDHEEAARLGDALLVALRALSGAGRQDWVEDLMEELPCAAPEPVLV